MQWSDEMAPATIQLPDLRREVQMPSMPAWLASLVASVKTEMQPDPVTGKHRMTPTLPASSSLDTAQRELIELHVAELERLCGGCPCNDPDSAMETLKLLRHMMRVLASTTPNEASAEARGEAFMMALDDVPTWAVAAALRRWYRGDGGKDARGQPRDCHWCPAPADLRAIALVELWPVKERIARLRDLQRAEPLIEFSDEHCAAMRARLAELFRFSPVGSNDGSGEKVDASRSSSADCGTSSNAQTRS
jgi:hypothetical protein